MILRVVRFTLNAGVEPEFMRYSRNRVRGLVDTVDGLMDVRIARRMEGNSAVVLAMTRWRDYEAIHTFLGVDFDRPRLWDPDGTWVASALIEHFEDELSVAKEDLEADLPR